MPDGRDDPRALERRVERIEHDRISEAAFSALRARVDAIESVMACSVRDEPAHPLGLDTRKKLIEAGQYAHDSRQSKIGIWKQVWPTCLVIIGAVAGAVSTVFFSHGGK